jgi:hypothetical protein
MMAWTSSRKTRIVLPLFAAVCLVGASRVAAQSNVIYYEDFTDATINTMGNLNNGTIVDGTAHLDDASATGRASFVVRWPVEAPLSAEVVTFQFDFTQPVVPAEGVRMEVLMRAGVGTANNTLTSAESVAEYITHRGLATDAGLSRIGPNEGNQTVFLVLNNKSTELTYASPVDGLDVTLLPYNYARYYLNRTTEVFAGSGTAHTNPAAEEPPRAITRFGIGSSTNSDIGTFAIDNVLIRSGVFFDRNFPAVPPPTLVGDFDGMNGVNRDDFLKWTQSYGVNAGADADNDQDSDGHDFILWQRNVGATGNIAAVPEPSALVLAAAVTLAPIASRRRRTT